MIHYSTPHGNYSRVPFVMLLALEVLLRLLRLVLHISLVVNFKTRGKESAGVGD